MGSVINFWLLMTCVKTSSLLLTPVSWLNFPTLHSCCRFDGWMVSFFGPVDGRSWSWEEKAWKGVDEMNWHSFCSFPPPCSLWGFHRNRCTLCCVMNTSKPVYWFSWFSSSLRVALFGISPGFNSDYAVSILQVCRIKTLKRESSCCSVNNVWKPCQCLCDLQGWPHSTDLWTAFSYICSSTVFWLLGPVLNCFKNCQSQKRFWQTLF